MVERGFCQPLEGQNETVGIFKREAVLTVAALCALATMVLVPPDAAYLGYIDLRVLCLLLCLMAVVAGFQSCGAFQWLAGHLLSRGPDPGPGSDPGAAALFLLHGRDQ
ncbi:MAG: hypothetical protein ACLTYN_06675 [Dysosmobacter welbionis]